MLRRGNMNSFDTSIIHFLNQFAEQSHFRDYFIGTLYSSSINTAFLASTLWWVWFRNDGDKIGPEKAAALEEDRKLVISGSFFTLAALFVARVLAAFLPYRERPMRNPALHLRIPFGFDSQTLFGWSSFPSDHATYFFAFGMLIWCLSRRAGVAVWTYFFFVSCLPLVYLGVHYPTDILTGALLGIAIGSLTVNARLRTYLSPGPLRWATQSPGTFYPCFFLITFLMGTMFEPLRHIAVAAFHATRYIVHGTA